MAKDEKVPDTKQCEEGKLPADRPRKRGQEALPGILGKQLRAAYGELLNAPVPDAITDLIKRLESQEAASDPPPKPDKAAPRGAAASEQQSSGQPAAR